MNNVEKLNLQTEIMFILSYLAQLKRIIFKVWVNSCGWVKLSRSGTSIILKLKKLEKIMFSKRLDDFFIFLRFRIFFSNWKKWCQRRYLTSKKALGTIGPVLHPTSSFDRWVVGSDQFLLWSLVFSVSQRQPSHLSFDSE